MKKLLYDCCPRCNSVLGLRPVASLFDSTGERYGTYLYCKRCGWYSLSKFYDVPKKKLEVD